MRFPVKTDMTREDAREVAAFLRELAALIERRCPREAAVEADSGPGGALGSVTLGIRW